MTPRRMESSFARSRRGGPNWSWSSISALAALAENEVWVDAADDLGITVSALSQMVRDIENKTSLSLFVRKGRRRVASEDLLALLPTLLDARASLRRLAEAVEKQLEGSKTLGVGMVDAVAFELLGRMSSGLGEGAGPRVQVSIGSSEELISLLADGLVDLAVVVDSNRDYMSKFSKTLVASEQMRVFAAPNPHDAWLMYPAGSHTRALVEQALYAAGLEPPLVINAESPNPYVLEALAASGAGYAVLPPLDKVAGREFELLSEATYEGQTIVVRRDFVALHLPSRRPEVDDLLAELSS